MKMTYKLKPFSKFPSLIELDRKKRNKIEETLEKKFTDEEWLQYKQMTISKAKN